MFLFLYQEFIHKKQYCYVVFDILDFVVKKSKRVSGLSFECLQFCYVDQALCFFTWIFTRDQVN